MLYRKQDLDAKQWYLLNNWILVRNMKNKYRRVLHLLKKFAPKAAGEQYWEYFNRQHFISQKIKDMNLQNSKILDVGGATGDNLLVRFGINNVTTLDIDSRANIVASAADMPLEDGVYDVVTCIDTLEHIPQVDRARVVGELVRVAARAVFLVAPTDSPENNQAEKLVLRYLDCRFVADHQQHGLVDFNKIRTQLEDMQRKGAIKKFEEVALDNLHSWVILMTRGFVNESKIYQEAYFLENRFCPKRFGFAIYKN